MSAGHRNWPIWWPSLADQLEADAATRLAAAIEAWGLHELARLPGGEVALVFAASCSQGEAVLKLSPRVVDSARSEADALELWARSGTAPQVLGVRDGGLTILMRRISPGQNLRDTGADADEIVATLGSLCPRVHVEAAPGAFAHLRDGAEAAAWRRALADSREHDELERLMVADPRDRLLHIDLHWLNVLRGPDHWVVIDPKPYVGDPHADVFGFFDGPPLSSIPRQRAAAREHVRRLTDRYARAAGLDRDRAEAWIRVRALAILGQAAGDGEPVASGTDSWSLALSRLADAVA